MDKDRAPSPSVTDDDLSLDAVASQNARVELLVLDMKAMANTTDVQIAKKLRDAADALVTTMRVSTADEMTARARNTPE